MGLYGVDVHLLDGTYELFRHFYGRRSGGRRDRQRLGAAAGVLHTVLQTLETGATHVGVATERSRRCAACSTRCSA